MLGELGASQRSRLKIQCWELANLQQIEDAEPAKDAKENGQNSVKQVSFNKNKYIKERDYGVGRDQGEWVSWEAQRGTVLKKGRTHPAGEPMRNEHWIWPHLGPRSS